MNASIDPGHVAAVCRQALAERPYLTYDLRQAVGVSTDDSGVRVVLPSEAACIAARRALTRHGYRLGTPPGAAASLRVAGWSPDKLARRARQFIAVLAELERGFPATIEGAVDSYLSLRDLVGAETAMRAAVDVRRAELEQSVTRRVGPLVAGPAGSLSVPLEVRVRIYQVAKLTSQAIDLLDEHGYTARRSIRQMNERLPNETPEHVRRDVITAQVEAAEDGLRGRAFLAAHRWVKRNLPKDEVVGFADWYATVYGRHHAHAPDIGDAHARWRATSGRSEHGEAEGAAALAATDFPDPPMPGGAPGDGGTDETAPPTPGTHRSPGGPQ